MGLDHVMEKGVETVNFIRSRGLNHSEFKPFLNEIKGEYGNVLYYMLLLGRGKLP